MNAIGVKSSKLMNDKLVLTAVFSMKSVKFLFHRQLSDTQISGDTSSARGDKDRICEASSLDS